MRCSLHWQAEQMCITLRSFFAIGALSGAMLCGAQVLVEGTEQRFQVMGQDTVLVGELPTAFVKGKWGTKAKRQQEKFDRLTRNVAKVYPYAKISASLLREYAHEVSAIEKEADQDMYYKLAEAELRAEFEEEVTHLTVSQGKLLIKLIDRETGATGYDIIKQLRGSFQAVIWQSLARLFGSNLKDEYDAIGTDANIEVIIARIEAGQIPVAERQPRTAKATAKLEKRKARLYKKYGLAMPTASTQP
ncbi:MAG: DUF4294 domain-containing protein [Flavobacteriales bacterium]